MGRYYFKVGRKIKGPLDGAEIAALRMFSVDEPLCPEELSPKDRRNWRRAASFPDILECRRSLSAAPASPSLEAATLDPVPPSPPAPSAAAPPSFRIGLLKPAAAAGLAALALFALLRSADRGGGARPTPPPAARPGDPGASALEAARALSALFRGRGVDVGEVSVSRSAGRPYELQWETPCGRAVLTAGSKAGEFVPANLPARRLLDGRAPCR